MRCRIQTSGGGGDEKKDMQPEIHRHSKTEVGRNLLNLFDMFKMFAILISTPNTKVCLLVEK